MSSARFAILMAVLAATTAGCAEDAPSIPHAVSSKSDDSCRSCHANAASGAPQAPHPSRSDCVGCHAVTRYEPTDAGAPPGIPHAITSNDDSYCLGCHQDGLNGAPKTLHPTRTGCRSCHNPI